MLAACATLIFILVLAVPHAAKAHRRARFFRAQQKWAKLMDRHEEEKKTSLWCARVAICQHHLECMAGSME
jgi:hypothetical protein